VFHPKGPTIRELAQQALSSTQTGYDLLAPKFDVTPFRTPDAIIEACLNVVGGGHQAAIDLCTGTGAAVAALSQRASEVVAIDFSLAMLARARRQHPQANVEWVHGDVRALPSRFDSRFDIATCFGALGHIDKCDESTFLEAVHRVLVPGGRLVIATAPRPPWSSRTRLLAEGFNAAMRLRNAIIKPAFVMYYLTFTLPDVLTLFERHSFAPTVHNPALSGALQNCRIVVAQRR